MTLLYIQGMVTLESYQAACPKRDPDLKKKNCVFIFPGNGTHHAQGTTLFSIKGGAGLAAASGSIGRAGFPTLSLPTTGMERWDTSPAQKKVVHGAIEDLYTAVGAGYHLMLPVRAHKNDNKYFESGLAPDKNLEPNFWGGIQTRANKPLAKHYIEQLDILFDFIQQMERADPNNPPSILTNNPFYPAYLRGKNMTDNDPWLGGVAHNARNTSVAPRRARTVAPPINQEVQKPTRPTEPERPPVLVSPEAQQSQVLPETFDIKMSRIISDIIDNIKGDKKKKTSRWTHFNSENKLKLLDGLLTFLNSNQNWEDENIQRFVIALSDRICKIKRNPLSLRYFSTHSTKELEKALVAEHLPSVDPKIHFSYLDLGKLLDKNKPIAEQYAELLVQFGTNECRPSLGTSS